MDLQVTDVPDEQRFEIRADGELAGVVVYHMRGTQIAFLHTETEDQFRGHGIASRLIRSSLDAARERHLSVLPYCPYVQRWLAEHPDYVDLVPADRRSAFGLLRLLPPRHRDTDEFSCAPAFHSRYQAAGSWGLQMDETMQTSSDQTVRAAVAGDEPAFAALTERHRRELHIHCYRMLASFDDAEDAVQETFLNAWRGLAGFDGGSQFRAWLYRIATNVCLDMLRRKGSSRRAAGLSSFAEVSWLQPYPDVLLDQAAPSDQQPEAVAIERETISLAFLAALQVLPPRQRAALIARDVLGWPASETASALGTSVAAANSALQRARATMQSHLPPSRAEWSAREPTAAERELLDQFIDAHERLDTEAAIALAAQDVRITMPPLPVCLDGAESIRPLMADAAAMGEWRVLPTAANRMPAAAGYLRRLGDSAFRAFKLDVMRMEGGVIAEITVFNADLFPALGLPPVL